MDAEPSRSRGPWNAVELEVPETDSLIYFDLCHNLAEAGVLISKGTGQNLWEQSRNRNHLARVYHYVQKSVSACGFSCSLVDLYLLATFVVI